MMKCIDGCKYAQWHRTTSGRLHPSGDGRCKWEMPGMKLPVSMYYIGSDTPPRPLGGFINRKKQKDCPAFEKGNE